MLATTEPHPNTRVSQLRTWLSKPPKQAHELTLRASAGVDQRDVQLGTWTVDEVVPELAVEVLQLVDEHTATVGGMVAARLTFISAAGGELKVKDVHRAAPGTVVAPESLADVSLDGSPRSLVQQAQAHAQAAVQQLIRSNAVVLQQSVQLSMHATQMTATMAEELSAARHALRVERANADALRELLTQGASVAEPTEGSGALAKLLEPHLPQLVQLLTLYMAKQAPAG